MDLILINADLNEIGPVNLSIDFEVGDKDALNNFELTSAKSNAGGIYIPGTEYGGLFEREKSVTDTNIVTYTGWTWRGLLSQGIITPPTGSDYRIVSGEANAVIKELLGEYLGGFFTVPEANSGLNIDSYQFKLYTTYLEGLMDMLEAYDYRLHIHAEKESAGQPIVVYVEAVAASTVTGVYNEDSPVRLTFDDNRMGINHLVCMGKGDLQERMRVDLYIDSAGKISQTQYYFGFKERTAYYDYSSAESKDDLIKSGTARLLELSSSAKLKIDAPDNRNLEVGDIVRGRKDGLIVEAPIIRKILNISNGYMSETYSIKGEN